MRRLIEYRFVLSLAASAVVGGLGLHAWPFPAELGDDWSASRGGRQAWRQFHGQFLTYDGPPISMVRRQINGERAGIALLDRSGRSDRSSRSAARKHR